MADSDRSSTEISTDSSGNRGSSKVEFSEDEETLIIRMYKLVGERWSLIAGRIPGRTAEEIEKYWTSRFSSIMGRNKWRELKHHYNVAEIEVPEPQEEDVAPLKTNRKRKRGEKEVGGTSAPREAEEVTSKAADANAVDLTRSLPPEGAPGVVSEKAARAAEQ
ncbi:transcription repressor MYB5, partial [Cajanus cajan]|uniref:transcription repressor MYB5 n=1 Tax=Cajanus cajan TaxID=3821 RepID=UPI00098D9E8D